jgi:hypothetical protein
MFELILADFAKSAGAGTQKHIVLQLGPAGWPGPRTNTALEFGCCCLLM